MLANHLRILKLRAWLHNRLISELTQVASKKWLFSNFTIFRQHLARVALQTYFSSSELVRYMMSNKETKWCQSTTVMVGVIWRNARSLKWLSVKVGESSSALAYLIQIKQLRPTLTRLNVKQALPNHKSVSATHEAPFFFGPFQISRILPSISHISLRKLCISTLTLFFGLHKLPCAWHQVRKWISRRKLTRHQFFLH